MSAEFTVMKLRESFARFRIPETVVSDNGSQFTSALYKGHYDDYTSMYINLKKKTHTCFISPNLLLIKRTTYLEKDLFNKSVF